MLPPPRTVVRAEGGLYALERALRRRGFLRVAGTDEAGRGACAGPLVAAAVLLPAGRRGEIDELADSKLLTPPARERVYAQVVARAAAHAVVVVPPGEVDARGLQVCNLSAMRRALAGLAVRPDYVLTDGFPVDGLDVPGLAIWKGDQVAACVAAASVVAKVTRDRIMVELDGRYPAYGFAEHKGYVTPEHSAALDRHGPCFVHRRSFANVACLTASERSSGASDAACLTASERSSGASDAAGFAAPELVAPGWPGGPDEAPGVAGDSGVGGAE